MLTIPPAVSRRRRRVKRKAEAPPLVLVSAAFDDAGVLLTLSFDRAINIAAYHGSVVYVNDGAITYLQYLATGAATLVDAKTVQIGLVAQGPWEGEDVYLEAGAGNGIVAVNDGGMWPGVVDWLLP